MRQKSLIGLRRREISNLENAADSHLTGTLLSFRDWVCRLLVKAVAL